MTHHPSSAAISPERSDPTQTLRRQIGKSPASWTVDDLVAFVRDRDIRLVSLMQVGGDGWLKTLDFVPRDAEHLADVLAGGVFTSNVLDRAIALLRA